MEMAICPEEVSLCILVHYFLKPPIKDEETGELFDPSSTSKQIAVFLVQEIKNTDTLAYTPLPALIVKLRQQIIPAGAQLVRHLIGTLEELASPDDLSKLFATLSSFLLTGDPGAEPPATDHITGVGYSSVLGLFVRRCRISYERMSYESAGQLYLEVNRRLLEALELVEATSSPGPRDRPSVEAFLEGARRAVDRQGMALPRSVLDAQLKAVEGEMPAALLVKLSSALQHRDHSAALDALHHFFDVSLKAKLDREEVDRTGRENRMVLDNSRGQASSALLMLTNIEASMGNVTGALPALVEALQLAQQQRDEAALANVLALLCRVLPSAGGRPSLLHERRAGGGSEPQLKVMHMLNRCLQKGQEQQVPHITAFTRLALAHQHLERQLEPQGPSGSLETPGGTPSSGPPSTPILVGQQLREVAVLQASTALAAAAPSTRIPPPPPGAPQPPGRAVSNDLYPPGPAEFGPSLSTRSSQVGCATAVHQQAGSAHLLSSASWALHGNASLSHLDSLISLSFYSGMYNIAPAADRALGLAQLIETITDKQGVDAGQSVIETASSQLPIHNSSSLSMAQLSWAHAAHLNSSNIHMAEVVAQEMKSHGEEEPLIRLQAARRSVLNLIASGDMDGAYHAASSLFTQSCEAGMQVEAAQCLLLLAKVHTSAGSPLSALPCVLSCLHHSQHLDLALLAAEAAVMLATILTALLPSQTPMIATLIEEQLPLVLAHGSLTLQAETQWALAETLLAGCSMQQLQQEAHWVLPLLRSSATAFRSMRCWTKAEKALALLAAVHDALGDVEARDMVAAEGLAIPVEG